MSNSTPKDTLAEELKEDLEKGLQEAIGRADVSRVRLLIESKCDPNTDFGSDNALTHAIRSSPLSYVHVSDSIAIIDLLIASKADVDRLDSFGTTPLYWAVMDTRLVNALLRHNPGVNTRSVKMKTALHRAVIFESSCLTRPTVMALITSGADVNAMTLEKNTPLHEANDRTVIECLLRHGAAPSLFVCNNQGHTPHMLHAFCRPFVEKFGRPPISY
jgi:ankyrin repeat protein